MLMVRPPLAKVAVASAIVYGITATVDDVVPAHLSTTAVSWLVKPLLGAYVYTFPPSSLPLAALFVGCAGLFLITVLFYLNHCVVDQPRWAVVGGWAPMLAGLTLLQLQSAFGAWWVSIDINHSGFPLAYCEAVVGSGVVATSWFVAPELFNPRLRRPWVVAIVGVVCVVPIALSGMDGPPTAVAVAVAIIVAALLIAGSRAQWRTADS